MSHMGAETSCVHSVMVTDPVVARTTFIRPWRTHVKLMQATPFVLSCLQHPSTDWRVLVSVTPGACHSAPACLQMQVAGVLADTTSLHSYSRAAAPAAYFIIIIIISALGTVQLSSTVQQMQAQID